MAAKTTQDRIQSIIDDAEVLPTIPVVAVSILRMAQDPRVSIEKMASLIEKDPALAAKTLRLANSSYYGAGQPIVNLQQALVRLGIRATAVLALSFTLVETCKKEAGAGVDYGAFWERSLVTSVCARRIATCSVRQLVDYAFVTALLADVACPFLSKMFPGQYGKVEGRLRSTSEDLATIESRMLGVNHAEVGAVLLRRWHVPEDVVKAVGAHHNPEGLPPDCDAFTISAVVNAASRLADIMTRGSTEHWVKELTAVFEKRFSFKPSHVDVILRAIGPEVQSVAKMLGIPLPPVDQIQAEAKTELLRAALAATQKDAPAKVESS